MTVAVGILVAFAIIFLFILAFKPNTKRTEVTKVDETGQKTVEYHETKETSAGGCAAKIIVFPIITIAIIFLVFMCST
jgi:amino acid transporter